MPAAAPDPQTPPNSVETESMPGPFTRPLKPADVQAILDEPYKTANLDTLANSGTPEDRPWHDVTNGIASGDAEWLALAPYLRRRVAGTHNAYPLDSLTDALSEALTTNPERVLGLMDSKMLHIGDICQHGLGPEATGIALKARHIAQVTAIESVDYRYTYPHYRDIRDGCLQSLSDAYTAEIKSR